MSKSTSTKRVVSAAKVRAFFRKNPNLVPEGFAYNVIEGSRGRLAPEVQRAFVKAQRSKAVYVEGVTDAPTVRVGRLSVPVAELRAFTDAKRGPISREAVEAYRLANA